MTPKYLLPDNYETIKATEILAKEGFVVHALYEPGLKCGKSIWQSAGAACRYALWQLRSEPTRVLAPKAMIQVLIDEIDLPIIVDAGIGKPVPGM